MLAALVVAGGVVAVLLAVFGPEGPGERTADGTGKPDRSRPSHPSSPAQNEPSGSPPPQPAPNEAEIREILGRAKIQIADEDLAAANELIREALALNSEHWEAHMLLGVVAAKRGDHGEALQHYAKAEAARPRDPKLAQSRAISLLRLGRTDEAHNLFSRALEWDPSFAEAYLKRGLIEAERDNFQRAVEDFTRYIDLEPQSALGYRNRAAALARLGKDIESKRDLMKARELKAMQLEQ